MNARFRALVYVAGLASVACGDSGIKVSKAEFGPRWPLTIDSGTLRCTVDGPRKLVILDTGDGIHYGVNGSARGFGFPDINKMLLPGKVPYDLQPLIDRGLTLCR